MRGYVASAYFEFDVAFSFNIILTAGQSISPKQRLTILLEKE